MPLLSVILYTNKQHLNHITSHISISQAGTSMNAIAAAYSWCSRTFGIQLLHKVTGLVMRYGTYMTMKLLSSMLQIVLVGLYSNTNTINPHRSWLKPSTPSKHCVPDTYMLCYVTVWTPVGYSRPFQDRVVLFNNLVTFLQQQLSLLVL